MPTRRTPPGLWLFLAALRWQESGSPAGNYHEANGDGAYQILASNWPAWVRAYASSRPAAERPAILAAAGPNASTSPRWLQNGVAAYKVTGYYYGAAEHQWRLVARIWNGGSPHVVPNPALCAGCTTDTYAGEVLAKADQLAATGKYPTGGAAGPTTAIGNTTNPQLAATAAASQAANASTASSCRYSVHYSAKVLRVGPSGSLCMDKPVAIVIGGSGLVLLALGALVIVVATLSETKAGKAATAALSMAGGVGGAVGKVATAAGPQARTARRETAAGEQARRLAPVAAEGRREAAAAAAERRREERAASINAARQERARAALVKASSRPIVRNYYLEPPPKRLAGVSPGTMRPLPDEPPF